jgi:hypothetical protein
MVILFKILLYKLLVNHFLLFALNFCFKGSIPIKCILDFGDGHRQTNGTNRDEYYTSYFSHNYTRFGEYNVSVQCSNELSVNTTQLIRRIRRENMKKKMIIFKDLMETSIATRFYLNSFENYFFRHANCLYLRNTITNEQMKLIWRKTTLEVIPTEVIIRIQDKIRIILICFFLYSLYPLVNIFINSNVIQCPYNLIF